MAKWSTLLVPVRDWSRASHAAAIENARVSATELCRGRVEREEVAAYLLARAAAVRRDETRIAHSG
jgi:hypothetical protein